ncbi:G patch domain and ankyrin repeat-containing protein 1 [Stigmatopora nigra]
MATLGFIPAQKQDIYSTETFNSPISKASKGQEAKEFYEKLLQDDKVTRKRKCGPQHRNKQRNGDSRQRDRRRRAETDSRVVERRTATGGEGNRTRGTTGGYVYSDMSLELQGLKLLRCAQDGDLAGLKDLLSKGVDINFQDSFFWTGVMCASSSGQRAAVRLLLEEGAAWVGVVDTRGRDARDLALQAGHLGVLEELENYGRTPQRQASNSSAQPQLCQLCAVEYTCKPSSHHCSTLHQFNVKRPPPTPHYCLPSSSKSYKMMLNCGWKPSGGLGPDGQGPTQPVATVLKRDQKGLGYGPMAKARVTHFKAGDLGSVNARTEMEKGKTKAQIRNKELQDKNWERDFRASFYCDA